jgi:hypothetical protein
MIMQSFISELSNLPITEYFNIYVIIFVVINIYNCIKLITVLTQIKNIINQQIEINNKINQLYIMKSDREAFIKTIFNKCIEREMIDLLILIEKQNHEIKIIKRKLNNINNRLK